MKKRTPAPVWAVLGAPLVGIPLLVGLLSLTAPTAAEPEHPAGPVVTIQELEEDVMEPVVGCTFAPSVAPLRSS